MVAELFPYKWPSYRGFAAAKIVHLIAQILQIQKIDPYIYSSSISSMDNTVQTFSSLVRKFGQLTLVASYKIGLKLKILFQGSRVDEFPSLTVFKAPLD